MNNNQLNRLAAWLPMKTDELQVKKYPDGYQYYENGIIHQSNILTPVIRYVKNYHIKDKKLSLCMITHDGNAIKVEEWMDEQAKQIILEEISKPFTLLDRIYK